MVFSCYYVWPWIAEISGNYENYLEKSKIITSNFRSLNVYEDCRDTRGKSVKHGGHFVPPGIDQCKLCVCNNGIATVSFELWASDSSLTVSLNLLLVMSCRYLPETSLRKLSHGRVLLRIHLRCWCCRWWLQQSTSIHFTSAYRRSHPSHSVLHFPLAPS